MRIVRGVPDPPAPPTRDGWPQLCLLPLEPSDVPGAEWEDFVVDGIGEVRGACVEVEGGWVFGLNRVLDSRDGGFVVYAFTEPENLPAALDALLVAAGLARDDLPWVTPDV